MSVQYSPLQRATIEAACQHFREHQKVLCADEAGLGKTFVARGVMEKLAEEKLDREAARLEEDGTCLREWWKEFWNANDREHEIRQDVGTRTKNLFALRKKRRAAICAFLRQVFPDQDTDAWVETDGKNRDWPSLIKQLRDQRVPPAGQTAAFLKRLVKALPLLIMQESGGRRRYLWDLRLPRKDGQAWLPAEPFRVLYVCSNLDIARQNVRRLVPMAQNSDRGPGNRPDRLSVLWYYLQNYPTPCLEIMPITAAIATEETPGSQREWEILGETDQKSSLEQRAKLRAEGEACSLSVYRPDLVIFDEFQNFGDVLAVANFTDPEFEAYVEQGKQKPQQDGRQSDEETLRRVRRLCQKLLRAAAPPKVLMLSATPFHTVTYGSDDQRESLNRLDFHAILRFLEGEPDVYRRLGTKAERERYLMETCGIFRSERIRLLGKDNGAVHLIACDGAGLLRPAACLRGEGQGNCARRAVFTTPHVEDVPRRYDKQERYTTDPELLPEPTKHPRFRRLLQEVTAPGPDDVTEGDPEAVRTLDGLEQLLWLPPVQPSRPLGGVFASARDYSKTLVFSNLKVTPPSVCRLLNKEVPHRPLELSEPERKRVLAFLEAQMSLVGYDRRCAKVLERYLAAFGGAVAPARTADELIAYCKDGCLADVLREYREASEDDPGGERLCSALKFLLGEQGRAFAFAMESVRPDIQTAFNAPFLPFVLMTTSIGAEGLDFHLYCDRLAHYTAPSGVVAMEQKNGRIDRRNSLAVRRWWSRPGSTFRLKQYQAELEAQTGGLCPLWDAGEGNLHYYFFYTRFTQEREELERLFQERRRYRESIGADRTLAPEALDLCPYHHSRQTSK